MKLICVMHSVLENRVQGWNGQRHRAERRGGKERINKRSSSKRWEKVDKGDMKR